MFIRKSNAGYEIWAPAKLNLTLEVLARRPDGFHEIETLMSAISLYDTLWIRACHVSSDIRLVVCSATGSSADGRVGPQSPLDPAIPADDRNLAVRALRELQQAAGVRMGAAVRLLKRIPAAAGLGGGSSDAAAALVGGNLSWQLGWSRDRLADVAARLGSDVPFFLHRSPAVCRGRGEAVRSLATHGRLDYVVVRPPVGLSTADVYGRCCPQGSRRAGPGMRRVPDRHRIGSQLSNRLQPAAEQLTDWITRLRQTFERLDLVAHQMSGSGTAYFGICRHAAHAVRTAHRLQGLRLGYVFRAFTEPGTLST